MGLPVIASRLGGMAEIIDEGETGLLFDPGQAEDLTNKIIWAQDHPEEMSVMGRTARARYEEKYCAETNLLQIENVYRSVMRPQDHD